METQLKQRLTGAILLVVIAVLVVPELLTGPKAPEVAAPVVGDAAPIRSYTIDLTGATPPRATRAPGDPAPVAAPTPAAASATAAPAAAPATTPASAPAIAPAPAPVTAAAANATPAKPAAATPGPVATPTVGPTVGPAAVPAAATASVATPAAAPSTRTASGAAVTQGFAVQLGSYANRDTVAKLTQSLRAAGFKVSVAQVRAGGKELQRVRVGPVADRAAAEALQSKLSAAGHKGPIVPFP